jgi:hypothetical protein
MLTRGLTASEQLQEQLDRLVDSAGIEAVLRGLSELAHERAERAREEWVSKPLSTRWTKLAVAVSGLAPSALGL